MRDYFRSGRKPLRLRAWKNLDDLTLILSSWLHTLNEHLLRRIPRVTKLGLTWALRVHILFYVISLLSYIRFSRVGVRGSERTNLEGLYDKN